MPAKKSANKRPAARTSKNSKAKASRGKAGRDPERLINQLMPYILSIAALFLFISYFMPDSTGFVGTFFKNTMFGLFSKGAWIVPFLVLNIAYFWKRDVASDSVKYKLVFSLAVLSLFSVLVHAFARHGGTAVSAPFVNLIELFVDGAQRIGGGLIGGFFGNLLMSGFGFAGTLILGIALILLFGIFLFGMTPHMFAVYIVTGIRELRAGFSERMTDVRAEQEQMLSEYEAERARRIAEKEAARAAAERAAMKKSRKHPVNDLLDDEDEEENSFFDAAQAVESDAAANAPVIDPSIFDAVMSENEAQNADEAEDSSVEESTEKRGLFRREKVSPMPKTGMQELSELEDGEIDLAKIFSEADTMEVAVPGMPEDGEIVTAAEIDLMVEKSRLSGENLPVPVGDDDEPPFDVDEHTVFAAVDHGNVVTERAPVMPEYVFPPLSLLKLDMSKDNRDMSGEIQQTATKLVETLRSFNVKTKIINVSRGPTITRYELQPEVGTKVRSIVNLVDDIALHLATSGVRIEAPIPGKEAVGIEVPNRSTSTVYIRELLESSGFKTSPSKVTTTLGMDVAGSPVLLDIAKMPHLLIAGTTGSGKSVCINSLIISMLYKARPDEVKFIMIDPKKVELNVYNGIPHLLVPVVSDPKKAAGALHWAVTEMERRYELIEGAGVRNLKGYNQSVANDDSAEKLPQIVIIIDELADLMMMARDDVEEAICRIAQKARAAGMHLVIGTQRPSVDVVTGLIKANVPSRIAFTTANQVDSRTIIDTVGAEKLIGRGDMLYAPIGSIKPTRVQGCFVSDDEVEEVTTFIKNNYGVRDYDKSVMDTIEREAMLCGNKKSTVMGDGDEEANDGDPMLRPAIQLAVESGKISTSLIQRRLQLGYGRAAKLIDAMEQMGIVSPPQGQKPRDVLISKSEYMEMELRRGE